MENEVAEKHVENVERLTRIEALMDTINKALFGNGQPGHIDKTDQRLSRLEKAMYMALGAYGLLEILHTLRGFGLLGGK